MSRKKPIPDPDTAKPCCFISIVGTQVFGTLNPLLAVLAKGLPLTQICLLATPQVQAEAERIKAFCEKRGLACDIHPIVMISNLTADDAAPAVAFSLAKSHAESGERCIFDLNGGTNALTAAALLHLLPLHPYTIQVGNTAAVLTDTENENSESCDCIENLSIQEILSLQGVAVASAAPDDLSFSIIEFCKRGKIPLPTKSLQNVVIGDLRFELVWSGPNNKLYFLYNAFSRNTPSTELDMLRNVEHWAQTRQRVGHLFDRTLYAISDNPIVHEHLKKESGGKIEALNAAGWKKDPHILREVLQQCFGREQRLQPFQPRKRKSQPVPDGTLVTMIGKDPQATFVAIATHRAQHVLLGYTQKNQNTANRVKQLLESKGGSEVRLFVCDPTGADIPASLAAPEHPETVAVHITPGTKGQGAFLACWAARQHCQVWAFNMPKATSERLDAAAQPVPIVAADSLTVLRAHGNGVHCADEDEPAARKEYAGHSDALLDFLRQAMNTGFDLTRMIARGMKGKFSPQAFTVNQLTLANPSRKKWELRDNNGTLCQFCEKGGEWLEHLVSRAFEQAGATDVHTRVRIDWSTETMDYLRTRYSDKEDFFVRDMDVLGSYGSRNFLVSCKARTDYRTLEKDAREAAHMAPLIGRFTLPFLCHLGCQKSYLFEGSEGSRKMLVQVIGWRDLCHPEKLQHYLEELPTKIS